MKRVTILAALAILTVVIVLIGCEKEKIVESTEYVHETETEYVFDTIVRIDTVVDSAPNPVQGVDTVVLEDTLVLVDTVTITETDYIYDTTLLYDTVTIDHNYYDTVVVTDTVETVRCDPNGYFAFAAMQYYCDPLVIQFIYQEFGYSDGWIYYLSMFQSDIAQVSSNVYDIYGYCDYWTPDWTGYYPLEYYWRLTFTGGDPSDVANWDMAEPPVSASREPGVRLMPADARVKLR
ncbi:MAG: hypothetical protein AB1483_09950 [Candidatus Zixiibacteriota bacterium]